jgi:hypothetical protein
MNSVEVLKLLFLCLFHISSTQMREPTQVKTL